MVVRGDSFDPQNCDILMFRVSSREAVACHLHPGQLSRVRPIPSPRGTSQPTPTDLHTIYHLGLNTERIVLTNSTLCLLKDERFVSFALTLTLSIIALARVTPEQNIT
jgi:hypothetical protein